MTEDEIQEELRRYPVQQRDADAPPRWGKCVECGHRGLCDRCYAENLRSSDIVWREVT